MFFRQPSRKVHIQMKIIAVLMSFMLAGAAWAGERPATKPGFEKQILDITFGEVWRPLGWHYGWSTTQSGAVWTVSKEDPAKGAYETGMAIQLVMLPESAGKNAEQWAKGYIQYKSDGVKVERRCDEKPNGDFKTICLETTEPTGAPGKNFRILYSVSWSNERGWVVVTTFGAPEGDWTAIKPTVDAMTDIVLVGEKFYAKPAK
jgi:hypothetical protein